MNKTIVKLKKIFKEGYLPSRDSSEEYAFIAYQDKDLAEITNCFEHACFNLTNEQLENFDKSDLENFFSLPKLKNDNLSREQIFEIVIKAIKSTSLNVGKAKETLKKNEWNVAMYFSDDDIDVHFLLQEKDGSWSGKMGKSDRVEHYSILPLKTEGVLSTYTLYKVFSIQNPFVKLSSQEKERCR